MSQLNLLCLCFEHIIISMAIKSKCLLVAFSRVIAKMGNPEARWTGMRRAKSRRNSYNRMEWWVYAAIK